MDLRRVMLLVVLSLGLLLPLSPHARAAATLELYGTFHAMGVIVTIADTDDPDGDATAAVAYRAGGDAYETLLLDVIEGDRSLFIRFDEVEECWRVVEPLLDAWAADEVPLAGYAAGSNGPAEAETLALLPGHRWRDPALS